VLFVSEAKGLRSFAGCWDRSPSRTGPSSSPRRCVSMPPSPSVPVVAGLGCPGVAEALGGLAVLAPLCHYGPPPRCSKWPRPSTTHGSKMTENAVSTIADHW